MHRLIYCERRAGFDILFIVLNVERFGMEDDDEDSSRSIFRRQECRA